MTWLWVTLGVIVYGLIGLLGWCLCAIARRREEQ